MKDFRFLAGAVGASTLTAFLVGVSVDGQAEMPWWGLALGFIYASNVVANVLVYLPQRLKRYKIVKLCDRCVELHKMHPGRLATREPDE